MAAVPPTMRVAQIDQHKQELQLRDVPTPRPGHGQVLVRIEASGVCHTDVHACDGDWPVPTILPLIPGHEGCGVVAAIGAGVDKLKIGDRVGIPWLYSACGDCEFCNTGRESLCTNQQNCGYSVNGCFAEFVLAAASHCAHIPDGVSAVQAAPILCAGVTTYSGIKHTDTRPGQWIAIIGAAGGLGHLAVQYAVAMGLRVVALDVGAEKLAFCERLGAEVAIDSLAPDMVDKVIKATKGGAHGVLCLAAALPALKSAVKIVRRGGTVVLVGLPNGEMGLDVVDTVLRAVTVRGSIVGTREDMKEALDFAGRGKVRSEVEVHPLSDVNETFNRLRKGIMKGRVVIDMTR